MLGEGASNIFVIIHAAANSFLSALEQLLQSVLAGSCRPVEVIFVKKNYKINIKFQTILDIWFDFHILSSL